MANDKIFIYSDYSGKIKIIRFTNCFISNPKTYRINCPCYGWKTIQHNWIECMYYLAIFVMPV